MKALKIIFKVLFFPLSLLISLFTALSTFIIVQFAGILNIISGIIFLAALVGFSQYLFGWPLGTKGSMFSLSTGISGVIFAFVLSPYGLPRLCLWLVGKLEDLNSGIKSI